jgi:DNA (cytosine-5)-methyltransferase 1
MVWDRLAFKAREDYLFMNRLTTEERRLDSALDGAFEEHCVILKELGYAGRDVSSLKSDPNNTVPKESERVTARMRTIPPDENHQFVRATDWEVEG